MCTLYFSTQKNKSSLSLHRPVILITHDILSVPRLVCFVFSTSILLSYSLLFVFLLLHKRLLQLRIWSLKNYFPPKRIQFLGDMADSRSETRNVQDASHPREAEPAVSEGQVLSKGPEPTRRAEDEIACALIES